MTSTIEYAGGEYLAVPSRNDFIHQELIDDVFHFLPIDVEDANEYRNGVPEYRLRMFGATKDGTKTTVIVDDVDVYFDILVPDDNDVDSYTLSAIEIFDAIKVSHNKHQVIKAKKFLGYSESLSTFIRVFFNNLTERRKAIAALRERDYYTASDDRSCYYRKFARDYSLPIATWMEIRPHTVNRDDRMQTLITNASGIKRGTIQNHDPTLVMAWDIEAYTHSKIMEVPDPEKPDPLYMICATFHWKNEETPFYRVCVVDKDTAPDIDFDKKSSSERIQTVICKSERNLIKAFAHVCHNMMPDVIIGFNDSSFDWNYLIVKARKHCLLRYLYNKISMIPRKTITEEAVLQWNYHTCKIKTGPDDSFESRVFRVPGMIPIDTKVCMLKHFKSEEVVDQGEKRGKLDFYLMLCGLPLKVDLPVDKQFEYYESNDPRKMAEIRTYCDIDAFRCQQLMLKQQILESLRKLAELSYVSFSDAHYTAIGCKVSNVVIEDAQKKGMLLSNLHTHVDEEERNSKFGGAKVFYPIKGLKNKRPIIPFDYASLYPSIMQAFNVSPDTYVSSQEEADRLRSEGKNLYEIDLEYKNEQFKAWFVRHDNDLERMGLIPRIQIDLRNLRNSIRKGQKAYEKKSVEYKKLEIEQLAVKVLMNSFYGVLGMKGHPLSITAVALTITTTGRNMINMVADYVTKKGWTIQYGDSVARWTPVFIRHNGVIDCVQVEDIANAFTQSIDHPEKEECYFDDLEVWSDDGWTKVHKIIRHAISQKRMFRVRTDSGIVDVTEDHSLLTPESQRISPNNLSVGDEILHHELPEGYHDESIRYHTFPDHSATAEITQLRAAKEVYFLQTHGYLTDCEVDEEGNYIIEYTKRSITSSKRPNKIVSITEIPYAGYVYDFTTDNHHFAAGVGNIVVHNTDSLYLTAPDSVYEDVDRLYEDEKITKLEYWTEMVERSMRLSKTFGKEINGLLEAFTGNSYLQMEGEEVKFPALFCGKKKYAAVAHYGEVDFFPSKHNDFMKDYFIRGIDFIKRGQSKLAITIGERILRQALHPDNELEVLDIVENVFRDAIVNKEQWSLDYFVESKCYKISKATVTGPMRFAERMTEKHAEQMQENERRVKTGESLLEYIYNPPKPGTRFNYIIAKVNNIYDIRGRVLNIKVGDRMEYVHVAKRPDLGVEVDIPYYIAHRIMSLCARFVNYHDDFQPPEGFPEDKIDDYAKKRAEDYLKKIINKYTDKVINHHVCKAAYKRAVAKAETQLGVSGARVMTSLIDIGKSSELDELRKILVGKAIENVNKKEAKAFAKQLLTKVGVLGESVNSRLVLLYHKVFERSNSSYMRVLSSDLDKQVRVYKRLQSKYNDSFSTMVLTLRTRLDQGADDDTDLGVGVSEEEVRDFTEFWSRLESAARLDVRIEEVRNELDSLKTKLVGYMPSRAEIARNVGKS